MKGQMMNDITLKLKQILSEIENFGPDLADKMAQQKSNQTDDAVVNPYGIAIGSAFGNSDPAKQTLMFQSTLDLLYDVGREILNEIELSDRVTVNAAVKHLRHALGEYRSNPKPIDFNLLLQNVVTQIEAEQIEATYYFPIVFSHNPSQFSEVFGPLTFGSSDKLADILSSLSRNRDNDDRWNDLFGEAWDSVLGRAKHYAEVSISGSDAQCGQAAGQRAVEFWLNLLRMSFKWDGQSKVFILGRSVTHLRTPSLILTQNGDPLQTLAGPRSEYIPLRDGDDEEVVKSLTPNKNLIGSIMQGMTNGSLSKSAALRQIDYASFLISSAYAQTSVRIMLVNMVSALETLACLKGNGKSEQLSNRCKSILYGVTDEERETIEQVVRQAYTARTEVVHGDAHEERQYWLEFRALEPWLLPLTLRFSGLLASFETENEISPDIKELRRLFKSHFDELKQ